MHFRTRGRWLLATAICCWGLSGFTAPASKRKPPKLYLVLVFDQFRADYLTRFESRFLPAKQKDGKLGGFRWLMEQGAYYPFAQYGVLQNMTGPGHATILSGAYPYQHGVPNNDWYDHEKRQHVYCAEDSSVATVGAEPKSPHVGTSPRNLVGTTLGDQLKNAGMSSQVVTVALKDRAAIFLGGHRADLALWLDHDSFRWVSSQYYLKDGKLPAWVAQMNQKLANQKGQSLTWQAEPSEAGRSLAKNAFLNPSKTLTAIHPQFPHQATQGSVPALFLPNGVNITVVAAEQALDNMKLGRGRDSDLLAVSFSSHDYVGHNFGPNSREMEELTVVEDRAVADFLNYVNKTIGIKNVTVALTADHGVNEIPEWLQSVGVPAGRIHEDKLRAAVEDFLKQKYNTKANWIADLIEFNFYFNRETAREAHVKVSDVARQVAELIEDSPSLREGIAYVFTAQDVRARTLPPGLHETQILHTYFASRSGDLMMIPRPHYVIDGNSATHMTGYTYDRTVPLILAGEAFKPGVYSERAEVIDLASTLAFVARVIAPSGAEGRVLSEALRP